MLHMADNYVQFSEQITKLTTVEKNWLENRLTELEEIAENDEAFGCLGFNYEFSGVGDNFALWFYSDEWAEFTYLEQLIKEFLTKFRPTETFSITWAATCSKPRIGEFGGGAMVISAADAQWLDVHMWAENQAASMES